MRILITGGTGLIGRNLCRLWLAQGHEVYVWSRTPERVKDLCGEAVHPISELKELNAVQLDAVINLARLLPLFRLGLGGKQGSGQQWMPWVHLHDEVALIDHLLHHTEAHGPYNACAPQPVRNQVFAKTLGQHVRRPAIMAAPAFVLKLLLGEMAGLLLGGQHIQAERTQAIGFEFKYKDLAKPP